MQLLIVNYHYFREEKYPSGIYPVNREEVARQVAALAKHYRFISQKDVAGYIKSGQYPDENLCLVTIDDGLKEQMDMWQYLQQLGVPSLLYVPTDAIEHNKVLNVHKLHYVRTRMNDEDLHALLDEKYGIGSANMDENAMNIQYRYDTPIARKVKYFLNFVLNEAQKEEATDYFFAKLVADETAFAKQLYMDEADLIKLAKAGDLGSHGSAHIPLASRPAEVAKADMLHSINYLETLTGQPVLSFSYPYGGKTAVNQSLQPMLQGTNVLFGLTAWRGINTPQNFNDPFFLLRIDTNDAPGGKNNSTEYLPQLAV